MERNVVTVTECGNTAAASIPVGVAKAFEEGNLKRGTKVLLVGGAAGFSVGVIPLIW
jgi:3-oxoacyl-[acyl-carrier-protein] synthase-3